MNEADDDKYVSVGFGRFKKKGTEDDEGAPTFKKDDTGKYVAAGEDDKGGEKEPSKEPEGGEEEPKPSGKALGKGDFERDLDDSEPEDKPFGGDTGKDADYDVDSWEDDEEAKAQAYADMEDEEDVEEESITINGQKYKPIKESKENPQLFKEIYERTFRSLK